VIKVGDEVFVLRNNIDMESAENVAGIVLEIDRDPEDPYPYLVSFDHSREGLELWCKAVLSSSLIKELF
jgi:hypothetical protein